MYTFKTGGKKYSVIARPAKTGKNDAYVKLPNGSHHKITGGHSGDRTLTVEERSSAPTSQDSVIDATECK